MISEADGIVVKQKVVIRIGERLDVQVRRLLSYFFGGSRRKVRVALVGDQSLRVLTKDGELNLHSAQVGKLNQFLYDAALALTERHLSLVVILNLR